MRAEVFKEFFIGEGRLFCALVKRGKVFCILSQRLSHSVIHNVRHGASAMNGLDAKGAMEFWLQINGGALGDFTHDHHLRPSFNIIML